MKTMLILLTVLTMSLTGTGSLVSNPVKGAGQNRFARKAALSISTGPNTKDCKVVQNKKKMEIITSSDATLK